MYYVLNLSLYHFFELYDNKCMVIVFICHTQFILTYALYLINNNQFQFKFKN